MLAAVPLLLSLVSASVIPVAKRETLSVGDGLGDEVGIGAGVGVPGDALSIGSKLGDKINSGAEVSISKREGFSIGGDIIAEIRAAIKATVHIPGIDDDDVLNVIVSVIDKGLAALKTGIEDLQPGEIIELIEKAIGEVTAKFGSAIEGLGGELAAAIEANIGSFLGISIN